MTESDRDRSIPPSGQDRHDADGQAYIAYFRRDPMMHFIWTGNNDDPVQVTHGESGEPIDATFEVAIAWDQHTEDVLVAFKHACDLFAAREDAETSTCRHCGRAILKDPEEGWIDPEAGYDDEDGDGIWRTTCDENHQDRIAAHEPNLTDPLDVWLRIPDGSEESEAEANTYHTETGYRVDWYLTAVGLVKSVPFDTLADAYTWLEREGFTNYTS